MGWELPTAAGDEVVNPKKTYPLAMVLVLVAAIATYRSRRSPGCMAAQAKMANTWSGEWMLPIQM